MGHLVRIRKGWESENLAQYILSLFSFIARPVTIGDDVGSDFYCTIFQRTGDNEDFIEPKTSFAIQIKSWKSVANASYKIKLTKQIDYLRGLEMPFFIGLVDDDNSLTIYSGENLPVFFSHRGGQGSELKAHLTERELYDEDDYPLGQPLYEVCFPFVAKLKADIKRNELDGFVNDFLELCLLVRRNLSYRENKQYVFVLPLPEQEGQFYLRGFAGPQSAASFRPKFMERLAEVFFNLEWLLDNSTEENSVVEEFGSYEKLYLELKDFGYRLPDILENRYQRLRKKILQKNL